METTALIILFSAAGIGALGVIAASLARAIGLAGSLHRAARDCPATRVATIRYFDFAPAGSPLRLASVNPSPRRRLATADALPVAA